MSFLNPALLAFASAVAVPILIHLLNRRRFQRVSWAAMRFVRASLEKNRRRMQFEDLLLLALRCLVVALLALALARPALRSASSFLGGARVAATLILDHSASLSAGDGARSRLDLARQAAEAAIDALPAGSSAAVLLGGDRVAAPIPEPSFDLNLVRRTIREAAPSELASDHAAAISLALELLKGQTALRKEIILVTDRQALGWRRLAELEGLLQRPEVSRDTRLRVVFVGEPLEDNLALSRFTRSPGFVSAREPVRFQAEIANHGAAPVRQVRVTLHVDGGPAVDEAVIETLAAGESRRTTLFARFVADGDHTVTARLPRDRQPADDERSLVIPAVGELRVLVADGDPASNSAFFLRHALQPVAAEVAPNYFLQPRTIPAGQLAVTRLAEYTAVILADPPPLPAPVVDQLSHYVEEGGAVIVFPGPKADAGFYNQELAGRAHLLPATLGKVKGDPAATEDAPLHLQASGYGHPVFALWNDAGAGSLAAARFRAAWELQVAAPRTNASGGLEVSTVMLHFADGTPAAVERTVGRGRIMMFPSTAGTGWNDLPVRPPFLPVLHRSIAALTDAQEARANIRAGTAASLRLPADLAGRDVHITPPDRPERRLTRTLRSGAGGTVLDFEETDRAGVYGVTLAGSDTPLARFAVQMDPTESDLAELPEERRTEIDRLAQTIDWGVDTDLRAAFEKERVGVEFWLPLALGVLVLAVTESWLSQRFSRAK